MCAVCEGLQTFLQTSVRRLFRGMARGPAVALVCAALFASGCSHTVNVGNTQFPKPVGVEYPLTVGIYLSEDFRNFTHHEDSDDRAEWNISTGRAQHNLFETVLGSMFHETITLGSYPQQLPGDVELVIVPQIRELQFTMPRETRVNIFEVWIKYDMHAYDQTGKPIAEWVITAYGKTPTAFLKSQEDALAQAINIALRDAGATLYTGFSRIPEMQAFLANKQRSLALQGSRDDSDEEAPAEH